jgi:hypothetical protein
MEMPPLNLTTTDIAKSAAQGGTTNNNVKFASVSGGSSNLQIAVALLAGVGFFMSVAYIAKKFK